MTARAKRRPRKSAKRNPLPKGYSRATVSRSIALLRREGKSAAVASAAAYRSARTAWRKRHAKGAYPSWLERAAVAATRHAGALAKRHAKRAVGALGKKMTLYAARANPSKSASKSAPWEVLLAGKPVAQFIGPKAMEHAKKFGQGLANANRRSVYIRQR